MTLSGILVKRVIGAEGRMLQIRSAAGEDSLRKEKLPTEKGMSGLESLTSLPRDLRGWSASSEEERSTSR